MCGVSAQVAAARHQARSASNSADHASSIAKLADDDVRALRTDRTTRVRAAAALETAVACKLQARVALEHLRTLRELAAERQLETVVADRRAEQLQRQVDTATTKLHALTEAGKADDGHAQSAVLACATAELAAANSAAAEAEATELAAQARVEDTERTVVACDEKAARLKLTGESLAGGIAQLLEVRRLRTETLAARQRSEALKETCQQRRKAAKAMQRKVFATPCCAVCLLCSASPQIARPTPQSCESPLYTHNLVRASACRPTQRTRKRQLRAKRAIRSPHAHARSAQRPRNATHLSPRGRPRHRGRKRCSSSARGRSSTRRLIQVCGKRSG